MKRLDEKAFKECDALQEVRLNNGPKSIGRYCFLSCKSLKHIELPTSLRNIETGAFDSK